MKSSKHVSTVKLSAMALAVAVVSAGCGSGSPSAPAPKAGQAAAPPVSTEPVELAVFYNAGSPESLFNERWGDDLRKKFPHISFKYIVKEKGTNFTNLMTSGVEVDLYIDSIGAIAAPTGLFDLQAQFDMTELAKKHGLDLSRLEPTSLDMIKQFGGLYGIPVHTTSLVLYYNKEIFSRFGVPFPKDGLTWDNVNELSKQLTRKDGDKEYIGLAVSPAHYFRMNQLSLPYVDAKTNKSAINTDAWKGLLQTVFFNPMQGSQYQAKIKEIKKIPTTDMFSKTREAAMLVYFVDFKNTDPAMKEFDWDTVTVPTFKDKPGIGAQTYPTYFSITNNSKKKDAAMQVINYVVSDEFQQKMSRQGLSLPVLNDDKVKKMFAEENEFKNKNNQAVFKYPFAPVSIKTKYDARAEAQLNKALLDTASGTTDINSALRAAQEAADKAIEADMKK
jgi:ABC-type glycerol-3-phosphate transport system substrate-binding protein